MEWTYEISAKAQEAADAILNRLDVEACLFTVEPRGEHCAIRIDHTTANSGWKRTVIHMVPRALLASLHDERAQERLASLWDERLHHEDLLSTSGRRHVAHAA